MEAHLDFLSRTYTSMWRSRSSGSALAGRDADGDELPGKKLLARIVEFGAQLLRAEPRIDRGRRKVESALDRIRGAVGEQQLQYHRGRAVDVAPGQLGEVRLSEAEAHPHGGHLVDGGEQAAVGVGRDQRAD